MQLVSTLCKLLIFTIPVLVAVQSSAQGVHPVFIPDTLLGPVVNLSIGTASTPILPGNPTKTKSFNNQTIMGPTILLRRGWNVEATVQNELQDTTTLHWHGLHVPAHADGGPHSPILPGQQWNPHFLCLDKAATYWYHPHFHGKTAEHTLQGATGFIIVRDGEEAALSLPRQYGKDDFPLAFQSLELDTGNQINPNGMRDSIVLVNGTLKPYLQVPAQWVRLRLLNASNARNFNFGLPGNDTLWLIGTDAGLLGRRLPVTRVRLAPGERAEILLNFTGRQGESVLLKSYGSEIPTGTQGGPIGLLPIGTPSMESPLNGTDFEVIELRIVSPTPNPIANIPDSLAIQTRIAEAEATHQRSIRFAPVSPGSAIGPFLVNDSSFNMNRIDFRVPVNQIEIWTIYNQTIVAHPFHLHGFPFYILDRYGAPIGPEEAGKRDMVLVTPNEELRIIVKFSDFADSTMPYMYHCHLLTHEDEGMMGQFTVSPLVSNQKAVVAGTQVLFPNPVADQFTFGYPGMADTDWSILDLAGRTCAAGRNSGPVSVWTHGWTPGLYCLKIGAHCYRLVKQ